MKDYDYLQKATEVALLDEYGNVVERFRLKGGDNNKRGVIFTLVDANDGIGTQTIFIANSSDNHIAKLGATIIDTLSERAGRSIEEVSKDMCNLIRISKVPKELKDLEDALCGVNADDLYLSPDSLRKLLIEVFGEEDLEDLD